METQQALPGKTGRRRHLRQDHHHQSGSSSTAGVRLTTPCSPRLLLLLLLLLTPSLPPSPPQRDTTQPTPPPTSLHLNPPGRGPTVFPQRGRKCPRVARDAAATKLKPRKARWPAPRPIRIQHSVRSGPLLLLRPVLCSPGGPSGRWLHHRGRGREA